MDVLMPQLGETVTEGKISAWYKKIGDTVKSGDNLFEIETDKVSMEVPATSAGILAEIRVQTGEVAPVGAVVAVIAGAGEAAVRSSAPAAAADKPPVHAAPGPAASPMASGATSDIAPPPRPPRRMDLFQEVVSPERNFGPARLPGGVSVTPLARRLASENGIDLARIKGSGPRGRITATDIESALTQERPGLTARGMALSEIKTLYAAVPYKEIPVDGMRKIIAARLAQSKQTVPHFYLTASIAVDALLALRNDANADALGRDAPASERISVNDFIIKALGMALQKVPAANAIWADDRILQFERSDIGVAVALDGGLLTPVVRLAESKSIGAISREMRDLAARARQKKLAPAEYQGGVTAISNLGMYGVREFAAIINPPHSTILAVGETHRAPTEAPDGSVRFRTEMSVTLACDHRVVDGALGAQLLAALKGYLEHPVRMLV